MAKKSEKDFCSVNYKDLMLPFLERLFGKTKKAAAKQPEFVENPDE